LYNYLEFFNDAFIFFPLKKISYSLKNIEQSIPKIYSPMEVATCGVDYMYLISMSPRKSASNIVLLFLSVYIRV